MKIYELSDMMPYLSNVKVISETNCSMKNWFSGDFDDMPIKVAMMDIDKLYAEGDSLIISTDYLKSIR